MEEALSCYVCRCNNCCCARGSLIPGPLRPINLVPSCQRTDWQARAIARVWTKPVTEAWIEKGAELW